MCIHVHLHCILKEWFGETRRSSYFLFLLENWMACRIKVNQVSLWLLTFLVSFFFFFDCNCGRLWAQDCQEILNNVIPRTHALPQTICQLCISPLICMNLYLFGWLPLFHLLTKPMLPGNEMLLWPNVVKICSGVGHAGLYLGKQRVNLCALRVDILLQNTLAWLSGQMHSIQWKVTQWLFSNAFLLSDSEWLW